MRTWLSLLLAPALVAQAPPPKAPIHRVEKLGPNSYAILAQGGNIGLFVGDHEAVLVDTQFERLVPGLQEAIRSVTSKPIRFLINTHHHGDHVGGNRLVSGWVQGIISHANARERMAQGQAALPAERRGGLPTLVIGEKDASKVARMDVRLPGLELHLVHRSAAHTDGDVAVGHPADKVLHLGDLCFLGMLPFIDTGAGGSFDGLVDTLDWFASWVPEGARIIPGHGPVVGRKELLEYRDFLKALQAHARANPTLSHAALAEGFPKARWEAWKPTPDFVTWEALFGAVTGKGPGLVERP